jgi:S-DNA-T family DNA segregation ATPase FtsK/SpoIIIE
VLPEPLASVAAYLGDDLDERVFIPTAELVEALDVEPNSFGRAMADLDCPSTRDRITDNDGETRRVRGYRTADIRAAMTNAES